MRAGNYSWDRPSRPTRPAKLHIQRRLPFAELDAAVAAYKRSVTPEEYTRLCQHLASGGEVRFIITVS